MMRCATCGKYIMVKGTTYIPTGGHINVCGCGHK